MEIVQINVPTMPDVKALFANGIEVPDVEVGGLIPFVTENWGWILLAAIVLCGLVMIFSSSKKAKEDKLKDEIPQMLFNQPVHYNHKNNGNV